MFESSTQLGFRIIITYRTVTVTAEGLDFPVTVKGKKKGLDLPVTVTGACVSVMDTAMGLCPPLFFL